MFRFIKARAYRAKADLFDFARRHLLISVLTLPTMIVGAAFLVIWVGVDAAEQAWEVVAYSVVAPLVVLLAAPVFFYIQAGGSIYADQLATIERLQHVLTPADEDPRMTFAELVAFAEQECGWNIKGGGDADEVLDLRDWIVDVTGVGGVTFYGRYNPDNLSFIENIPVSEIDPAHWIDNEIVVFDVIRPFFTCENIQARSRPRANIKKQYQVYCDIRLDRQQAQRALKRDSEKWRGRHARQRQRREQPQPVSS